MYCPLGPKTLSDIAPIAGVYSHSNIVTGNYYDAVDYRPITKNTFVAGCFTSTSTSAREIL